MDLNVNTNLNSGSNTIAHNSSSTKSKNTSAPATILDVTDEGSGVQCIHSLFVTGSTACSLNSANGASVVTRDPYSVSIYNDAGNCNYSEYVSVLFK